MNRSGRCAPRVWRPFATLLAGAALLISACAGQPATTVGSAAPSAAITVAAASDLRPAFEELGARFRETTGTAVTFSFGSSGQLGEQIINGAPFDLFASANVEFVDEVIAAGRGIASTKAAYALGRIVLWSPAGVAVPRSLGELNEPRFRRIAIANPEHAPYGMAAKQALESAGVYTAVRQRLVYGENISDTFRIAQSANADVGIVALSLALADGGDYTLIPAELHAPLEQALVVTSRGARGQAAARFADFVASPAGRAVMVRYGFVLPSDTAPGS